MLILRLTQPLGPGVPDPAPVGREVLHVAAAEVAGDLVERVAALGGIPRITDLDLIQDRGEPGVIEGRSGQVRAGLDAAELVEQRCQAQVVEPGGELVQPGQLPGRVLVSGQRRELACDVVGR